MEAVTAARAQHRPLSAGWLGGVRCSVCDWEDRALLWPDHLDAVAVAALDAYTAREAGYPTMRDSDEADLRERVAQEIEAESRENAHAACGDPSCADCSYVAALDHAARIARGQS